MSTETLQKAEMSKETELVLDSTSVTEPLTQLKSVSTNLHRVRMVICGSWSLYYTTVCAAAFAVGFAYVWRFSN